MCLIGKKEPQRQPKLKCVTKSEKHQLPHPKFTNPTIRKSSTREILVLVDVAYNSNLNLAVNLLF